MLKRLELIGFKSFAGKTTLDFTKGITAIVGPNGSGKSNVIDALRWLLGERDAKNLRGAKSEDLVFAGTPTRPRVGLAQASIYFDNSSSFFPVEFSEVVVSRQVARDGDSKYFLNKAEVRLKDLVDFFAKVRLGARGLVVIGQGASDLFVAANAVERREMIEEILGLREYQLKKNDAERRHKTTLVNIDKVSALLEEIAPHLRILKRQTSKWEKRSEIESELRDLERSYFGVKLAEITTNFSRIDPQVKILDGKMAGEKKILADLEVEVKTIEKEEPGKHDDLKKIKDEQSKLFAKRSSFEKELGRLEAQLEFWVGREKDAALDVDAGRAIELIKTLKSELEKFAELDLDAIRRAASRLIQEISNLFKSKRAEGPDVKELEDAKDKAVASLEELNRNLETLHVREREISATLESQNSIFKKAVTAVEEKKNDIYTLESEKNKLLFDREKWNLRHQDLETQVTQAGLNFNDFTAAGQAGIIQLAKATSDVVNLADLERRILRMRGELASIGEIDEATVKEASETESRHVFLSTQLGDLQKALHDLENLKKDLEEKISHEFENSLEKINHEFAKLFELMFGGGKAKLKVKTESKKTKDVEAKIEGQEEEKPKDEEEEPEKVGIDIEVSIPRKRITGLEMLSGGERSLVSIAALFAMVSVSPPPFLVLDEIDAALDERNARRFAEMLKKFSEKTQFVVVTHNRATMESADVLYGVTMGDDGTSKVLSLKLEGKAPAAA